MLSKKHMLEQTRICIGWLMRVIIKYFWRLVKFLISQEIVLFFFFYLANKCSKFLFLISDFLFFPVYLFHPNLGSNLNILFFFFLLIPELLRNWAITKWLKAYHNLWKCLTFFFSLPVQYPNHKEQIVVLLVVFFLISDSASFSYFNELTSLCDPLTYNRTIWLNYF